MSDREDKDTDEVAKAEALRRALGRADAHEDAPAVESAGENGDPDGLAELAASLRAAHAPTELSPKDHEEILSRSLPAAKSGGGRVIRVTFGVVSAMAMAAALILYLRPSPPPSEAPIAWVRSRSTAPLFSEPWRRGEATARIDRIALAREHDFRENRFAARLAVERQSGRAR